VLATSWLPTYRNASLQTKFVVQALVSTLTLFVVVMVLVLYVQRRALLSTVEVSGFEMTKIFAFSSVPAVATGDYLMLQHVVNGIASEPRVLYAMLLLPDGQVFAHSVARERGSHYRDALSQRAAAAGGPLLQSYVRPDGVAVYDFAVPVYVLTRKRAIARVGLSIEREMAGITRTGLSIVFLGLAALTFSLVWAVYQSRKLARPLEALVEGTREVVRGNLAYRLAVRSGDEIGQLAAAFNRMAEEVAATQGHLVEKTRMATMGEMAAMVAHETRNPLGALSTCLQLFRRRAAGTGEDAELLDIMQGEVRRLTDIVSDYLAFGRPRPLRIEPVDLPELIGGLLTLLERDRQVTRGVRVSAVFDPAAGTIPADPAQFRQILWNLLLNAAQALEGDGELAVRTAARDGWVDVTVADSGSGIPAATLSRIFDPFFTTRANGSGIGLAVVKRIVDEHGGRIQVESSPGAGTTVVVSLPRLTPSTTPS